MLHQELTDSDIAGKKWIKFTLACSQVSSLLKADYGSAFLFGSAFFSHWFASMLSFSAMYDGGRLQYSLN